MRDGMRGLILAGVVVLFSGCAAQPQYQMMKSGVTSAERTQDDAYCRMMANNVQEADYAYRGSFLEGVNIKNKQDEAYKLCMTSKGYSPVRVN
ncbi:hypothetical protein ACAW63_22670 [Pseudomonas sp. QE6]|uniref:hypothetical protein n=1 Tax=Pseudomonas sp. QE6 TaxID=3242491 RepID=UPI0035281A13